MCLAKGASQKGFLSGVVWSLDLSGYVMRGNGKTGQRRGHFKQNKERRWVGNSLEICKKQLFSLTEAAQTTQKPQHNPVLVTVVMARICIILAVVFPGISWCLYSAHCISGHGAQVYYNSQEV